MPNSNMNIDIWRFREKCRRRAKDDNTISLKYDIIYKLNYFKEFLLKIKFINYILKEIFTVKKLQNL